MGGDVHYETNSFSDYENRFVLAEVLKASRVSLGPLLHILRAEGIQPNWESMLLPVGRSVSQCTTAFDLLLRSSETAVDHTTTARKEDMQRGEPARNPSLNSEIVVNQMESPRLDNVLSQHVKDIVQKQVRDELDRIQARDLELIKLEVGSDTKEALESKLRKHQQANEAFQRTLREIGGIVIAVTNGDLSQKIAVQPIEMDPEIATFKLSFSTMVDQLVVFSNEASRIASQVGKDGILGGQGLVPNANGIWKELIDNVNSMATIFTCEVREISSLITAVIHGDFTPRVQLETHGEVFRLQETVNSMVSRLQEIATEVTRVTREVRIDGILGGQVTVEGVVGIWKTLVDDTNAMANSLTDQTRIITEVAEMVTCGELTGEKKPTGQGEIRAMQIAINTMLSELSTNWTHVTGEVGKEGRLGHHDQKLQRERLDRIWTILHSNI